MNGLTPSAASAKCIFLVSSAKEGSTLLWKCFQAFESHGCLTNPSPPSLSLRFSLCHFIKKDIAGLRNILWSRDMIGKCLRTLTGYFLQSASLNRGPSQFGQCSASTYSPLNSTHLFPHAWMLLYNKPNVLVKDFAA
jgi:hypothetical protein